MQRLLAAVPAALLAAAFPLFLGADERKFTYSYEARTLPEGSLEFEHWTTLKAGKEEGTFLKWEMREELEYGLLDRLTTALYLNWEVEHADGVPGLEDETETEFESVSSEWKWKILDPTADPVGVLAYAEAAAGPDEQEIEFKAVFSKDLGDFTLACNFIFEAEREEEREADGGKEWEKEYALSFTAGISWRPAPGFGVGVEGFSLTEFEGDFSHSEQTVYFVGPAFHLARPGWWFTLTVLRQVDLQEHSGLDLEGHEKYEARLILGIHF